MCSAKPAMTSWVAAGWAAILCAAVFAGCPSGNRQAQEARAVAAAEAEQMAEPEAPPPYKPHRLDAFFRALMDEKWQPTVRTVDPYFEHPLYIEALAQSIERAYAEIENRPDILVCSYHGVPKRYLLEGDPYHCQCAKTTRLLRERLGWDETEITTTFQSRFGPEEWLKPYTVEEVARLAEEDGKKKIAVCAPAFSADCIETLEEINEEIKESFEEAGGEEFTYIPCLNDDDAHIEALCAVIRENMRGWVD